MAEDGRSSAPRPSVSIVIPAHNEAAVLRANLASLLAGADPDEFDVIVVPNGCSDATAAEAARPDVRVVVTEVPGKPHAIRLGDAHCRTFPRLYLDADVALTADGVRALVAACAAPNVLASAPRPEFDLADAGAFVRRVHRVHDRLMAPGRALAGAGAYTLTAEGHARVFPMPDVISDDGWVHTAFAPHERVVAEGARTVVQPARTLRAHLRRRVRVRLGNRQLAALGRRQPSGGVGARSLARMALRREVGVLDAGCYLAAALVERVMTWRRGADAGWGADASSRAVPHRATTG